MKLGKLAPKQHSKTLSFAKYAATLPEPPAKVFREYKVPAGTWGVMANDNYGDCTCAAIAHIVMLVTSHTGEMVVPSVDDVLKVYTAVSGFQIGPPALNDNGAVITDVLEYWRTTGIAGHKILGWAQVDHHNLTAVKWAIDLFGSLDIGVQFPGNAMDQFNQGVPWEVEYNDGGIEGGHSIANFGYGKLGTNCITWGQRQGMSWEWFAKYVDEAYAVVTEDWINQKSKRTPSGLDLATLTQDLKNLSV